MEDRRTVSGSARDIAARVARTFARPVIVTLLASFAALGCGNATAPAASAEPRGSHVSGPAASLPPGPAVPSGPAPSGVTPPPSSADPGLPLPPPASDHFALHADPALEARLPAIVDGIVLDRYSARPAELLPADVSTALAVALAKLGISAESVTIGGARDRTGALGGWVDAYRVAGGDALALRLALLELGRLRLGDAFVFEEATLAGRSVTSVTIGPGAPSDYSTLPSHYLYADGDVVFIVYGPESTAAALLGAIQ